MRGEHIELKPRQNASGYNPEEEGLDSGKYMEEKERKLRDQVELNLFCGSS